MLGPRGKLRARIYTKIPTSIKNHDFELFTVLLCLSAGVPLLFDQVEPKSLESELPHYVVTGWAVTLIWGGLSVAMGIMRSYRRHILLERKIYWMRVEAFGLTLFGWASLVYGVCIVSVDVEQGWAAAMYVFLFMLTCFTRELGVQDAIDNLKRGVGVEIPPVN